MESPPIENDLNPAIGSAVSAAVEAEAPWWQGITRYQWIVLLMTCLGLMFDLMDSNLLGLAMSPALRQLLGARASTQAVGWYGGLVTTIFLVGWSVGGILFGIYADYFGRKSALMITILLYSVFTGLSMFSHFWWDFAIYRFIAALGIGGEWSAGTALLAETWPERARVKSAVILQGSSMFGGLGAALINLLVGAYSWRYLFLAGAFPGFLLLGLRWWVKESDRWLEASSARSQMKRQSPSAGFTLKRIFSKEMRRDTLVGTSLATIVTLGYWAVGWFVPTMISELLTQGSHKVPQATVIHYVSTARILIAVGSILPFVMFLFLGTQWRRKMVLLIFYLASFISTLAVLHLSTSLETLMMLLPLMGFFTLGIWVVFPIYLPELYPTQLRGTGSGFCFTFGRAISAIGPVVTGALVAHTGSFVTAMSIPTFIYLLGPLTLLFARETRGQKLQ